MKQLFLLFIISLIFTSCNSQTDLMKLKLDEKIESIVDFNNRNLIGVETVEYPFCLLLEIDDSKKYNFDGIDLEKQRVYFQVSSELLKTDSITKQGGAHIDLQQFKDEKELTAILKKFKSVNNIYGFRIEMKTANFKKEILKKIESKYGKGIKNPNTDNGLYWDLKKQNRYIFYAPDYDRLIVLNNTSLSKTCYWDVFNGLIDFGGCDNESYTKELMSNTKKLKEIKNRPVITIDKGWNINEFIIGKSDETIFVKSNLNHNLEKTLWSENDISEIIYKNDDLTLYFTANKNEPDNLRSNIIKGYFISDFKNLDLTFDNGLKIHSTKDEVLKIIDKHQIENYNDLKFSNYIEIKNKNYKINLMFDENKLFSSIYLVKK
jgi:hypothetical protein